MNKVELEFYTVEEKEPPLDKLLLVKVIISEASAKPYDSQGKDYFYDIYTYTDDSEYGKVFSGYENYWELKVVKEYAVLPEVTG